MYSNCFVSFNKVVQFICTNKFPDIFENRQIYAHTLPNGLELKIFENKSVTPNGSKWNTI